MFTYLKVKDFALIEDIEIEFKAGFTAFVGETGAGKSLLVDAINILSGARSSTSFLKKGSDFAYIEGGFFLEENHAILLFLKKHDIEIEHGEDMLVSRKITKDGRTTCKIQGNTVPVQLLKQVMNKLVDIHGQQENSYLLEQKNHLFLLDIFANNRELLGKYKYEYTKLQKMLTEKQQLAKLQDEITQLPVFEKQLSEIIQSNIQPGEIEEITEQFQALKDFSKNFDVLQETQQILKKYQVSLQLYQATKNLEKLSAKDETTKRLFSIYYELQDIEDELTSDIDSLVNQKSQQEEIEQRISHIFSMQKKYGDDLEVAKENLEAKIQKLQNIEYELIQLEKMIVAQRDVVQTLAINLHEKRVEAGNVLSASIMQQLTDLYMEKVLFKLAFKELPLSENGTDSVEFMIQSNVGSDFQPMIKIASGGELSRIMLAIKVIFTKEQTLSTIIFDEIDTGVSGKVAQAIAKKMQVFGKEQQVFAITHLPQVLAASTQQLLIEKYVENNMTHVKVSYLSPEEHEIEVAKMLSGTEVHQTGIEHARELIHLFQ